MSDRPTPDFEPRPRGAAGSKHPGSVEGPLVLGIETSCDDTACALVDGAGRILASVVSSQLEQHRPYGGVVPEIASRQHLRQWLAVSGEALRRSGCTLQAVEAVAVTSGPGLVGSLLVGLSVAKAIAFALDRPFLGVHHLEGHLYSPFLDPEGGSAEPIPETFVGLVVSGGHTALYRVRSGGRGPAAAAQSSPAGSSPGVVTLGQTRDDAMGEAFDKVGKRLGLPFPGGPHVDALAEEATESGLGRGERRFALARCGDSLDFSYSGLKTQMLVELERLERSGVSTRLGCGETAVAPELADLVAGFREAAVAQVLDRLSRFAAMEELGLLAVSGGAAANRLLRRRLLDWGVERGIAVKLVPLSLSGDNAAMIAHAGLRRLLRGERDDPRRCEARSRAPLGVVQQSASSR